MQKRDLANRAAGLLLAPGLAWLRRNDNGADAGMGVTIVDGHPAADAITGHSCIEQERLCFIGTGNDTGARLSGSGVLRVGRGCGHCQPKRDG
jgi:hypothetical protein